MLAATGVLLAAGATTGVVAIAADDTGKSDRGRSAEAPGHAKQEGSRGYGPPSWAHGHGDHDKAAKQQWKDAWRALSPTERKQRMRSLAAEHEAGMKEFSACVKAAKGQRGDCEKPIPPGQAKKQS